MHDFDGLPVLIRVPVAAKILGISRAAAYRLAGRGLLPVKRFERDGTIYIVRDRLRDMIEEADRQAPGDREAQQPAQ